MDKIEREKEFHNKVFSDDSRDPSLKYYSIAAASRDCYTGLISERGSGKRALEYGCGPGSSAFLLAKRGATVTGIDISEVAIERAELLEEKEGLGVTFRVMNAEELLFPDGTYDLICGSGILHHLHLERAYAELARTLTPQGSAVFLEPLGHNLLINAYRRLTPQLRTADEHPLLMRDLELARRYFGSVQTHFFHLSSLCAVCLRGSSIFPPVLRLLDGADNLLFRTLPFTRRYAWAVVLVLSQSKVQQGRRTA